MTLDIARAAAQPVSDPEIMSAREDAGRICVAVLAGTPASKRSLVVRVGERYTTVVFATGSQPAVLWNLDHGRAMVAAAQAAAANASGPDTAGTIRAAAADTVAGSRLRLVRGASSRVIGISNMAHVIVTLAAEGESSATAGQLRGATDTLAETWAEGRTRAFPRGWVGAIMIGAALLEAVIACVGALEVSAIQGVVSTATPLEGPERRVLVPAQRRQG
jgi:hypothetical protein